MNVKYDSNVRVYPYTLIYKENEMIHFMNSPYGETVKIRPTEEQEKILEALYQNKSENYNKLCNVFSREIIDKLMEQGCLISENQAVDTQSIYSRTDAFFHAYAMKNQREELNRKKVLILGCGGIGTHMAWHMATLGVAKLTLVDFDTIEISNLNRQILFNQEDAGSVKVEVLKEKLSHINQDIEIETISKCISHRDELEDICLSDTYDLIIKALDSPSEFPLWLDQVATTHRIPYVAGITMLDKILVGPTFIPGLSQYGWSELMNMKEQNSEKIYGISPSLGIMLYHISSELAIEAFKILSGQGEPKYVDNIHCKNIITGEEMNIRKKSTVSARQPFMWGAVITLLMSIISIHFHEMIPVLFLLILLLPQGIYKTDREGIMCTFLYANIGALVITYSVIQASNMNSIFSILANVIIGFGIQSAVVLGMSIISFLLFNMRKSVRYVLYNE